MRRLLTTLGLLLCLAFGAFALHTSEVSVNNGSGPYFCADDGNCGGSVEIPRAAYIAINVTNTSSTDTLYNVKVKLDSIGNVAAGFKLLSFPNDSSYTIPRILPNDSAAAYFYIQYPCTKAISCMFKYVLSNDSAGVVNWYNTMVTFDIQPAAAGGDIIAQNISGIDALGILLADTVTYEFGNFNGKDMIFQPCGDTAFPTGDLELIGSQVLTSPFGSCGLAVGARNTLYVYDNGSGCGGGSGNQVKVVYYYLSSLYIDSAVFKPYAGMRSGNKLIKYLSNYATGIAKDTFITTAAANKFQFEKSASCGICTPGDTITYTIKVKNLSSETLMFDKILDSLPMGHTYVGFAPGSDINETNSSIYPDAGATGSMEFTGLIPEATFPYRSYTVLGGDSVQLKYLVEIPGTSSSTVYENRAIGQVGAVKFDTAFAQTCAGCPALPVAMIYFNGIRIGETVQLNWSTATEVDNAGFDVYREGDVTDAFLDFIPGNGTKFTISTYQYEDIHASVHATVYRLVQKDFNGEEQTYYTRVSGLLEDGQDKGYKVYPNPSSSKLNVFVDHEANTINLRLVNLLGEEVISTVIEQNVGKTHTILDIEALPIGVYFVEVELDGRLQQRTKVLKN